MSSARTGSQACAAYEGASQEGVPQGGVPQESAPYEGAPLHPLTWMGWLGAGAVATLLTRNPLYLILLLAIFILVSDVERAAQRQRAAPRQRGAQQTGTGDGADDLTRLGRALPLSPLRLALFAIPASAIFNLFTSHVGETVLFRLPGTLPLIGGNFTGEALAYGAINGLMLVTLFAAFAVLNLAVSIRDLIAYVPRAFYPVAIVSAIAVTFVPNTARQFQQVREAQAIRGHRMRGWRDWLPLFLPVLIGGLERALQLAETMTSRGFGGRSAGVTSGAPADAEPMASSRSQHAIGPLLVIGLLAILAAGGLQLLPNCDGCRRAASLLLLVGVGVLAGSIWRAGRGVYHTRYRTYAWRWTDTVVVGGALLALLPLLLWAETRVYSPYPRLTWPPFELRVGGLLLLLMAPAFVRRALGDRESAPQDPGKPRQVRNES